MFFFSVTQSRSSILPQPLTLTQKIDFRDSVQNLHTSVMRCQYVGVSCNFQERCDVWQQIWMRHLIYMCSLPHMTFCLVYMCCRMYLLKHNWSCPDSWRSPYIPNVLMLVALTTLDIVVPILEIDRYSGSLATHFYTLPIIISLQC